MLRFAYMLDMNAKSIDPVVRSAFTWAGFFLGFRVGLAGVGAERRLISGWARE